MGYTLYADYLLDEDGKTQWLNKDFTSGTAEYSKPINMRRSTGFSSLIVWADASADMDISMELSHRGDQVGAFPDAVVGPGGDNWFNPYDQNDTDLGLIYTAFTDKTSGYWIQISVPAAPWLRFKFDPDANSTISAVFIYKEEN